ncbi:hypothetical protein JHK82_024101 [Glycine max]|nr:hypothetical protein JHK82_024101 [Glycine max]
MSTGTSSLPTTFSSDNSSSNGGVVLFMMVMVLGLILIGILIWCSVPKCINWFDGIQKSSSRQTPDTKFMTLAVDKFLNDMEREKLIRFTDQQLRIATDNYSSLLGSGGFGKVYRGSLSNGTMIAVKVLPMTTKSVNVLGTPTTTKYEIKLASV